MIKLPDYSQCVELKYLLLNMGIHEIEGKQLMAELPDLDQEVEEEKDRLKKRIDELNFIKEKVDFYDDLEKTGSDLTKMLFDRIKEIKKGDLLSVEGFKCCAYIKKLKKENYEKGPPRYHLFRCDKIDEMITKEKYYRFVLTTRTDGLFPIIIQTNKHGAAEHKEEALEFCGYCKKFAKTTDIYSNSLDKNNKFSLELFFKDNRSRLPPFKPEELEVATRRYAENHKQVAKRYKEACNYRCQICGLDLTNNGRWLHLHHINGEGTDNRHVNLRVLCLCCHAEQYNHSHMKSDPRWQEGFPIVHGLRKEQGIYSIR